MAKSKSRKERFSQLITIETDSKKIKHIAVRLKELKEEEIVESK